MVTSTTSASNLPYISRHLGSPYSANPAHSTRVMLLGSGELGKEIAIEAMRLGAYVIAVDSYEHAPAMHVAHESHVLDMSVEANLIELFDRVQPNIVVPEVEAIATSALSFARDHGVHIVPSVEIAQICMDRQRLRTLAAEECGVPTSNYRFASSEHEMRQTVAVIGMPCVVKPILSSSGHGQSIVRSLEDVDAAWRHAQDDRRTAGDGTISPVIVEELVPLDYELTVLTVASRNVSDGGLEVSPDAHVVTCTPLGHTQINGDYRESWQPARMPDDIAQEACRIAQQVVSQLVAKAHAQGEKGWGVYGVEIFVLTDGRVLFNEVSPRPHDTGMVTMLSQDLSEFALHARAILGLPVSDEHCTLCRPYTTTASRAVVVEGQGEVIFSGLEDALARPHTDVRLFGKPEVHGSRRMAVLLAQGADEQEAREVTADMLDALKIEVKPLTA